MTEVCEKCGKDIGFATAGAMIGGRWAYLCNGCKNTWHEFVTAQEIYTKYKMTEFLIASAASRGDDERVWLTIAQIETTRELHALSVDWLENKISKGD